MNNINRIVNHFLNNKTSKQVGQYATNGNTLVFIPTTDQTRHMQNENNKTFRDLIAVKFNNVILGNSSVLKHTPKVEKRGTETEIQRTLNEKVIMVPFNVFAEAKLDLSKFVLIEKGPEEKVKQKVITKVLKKNKKRYENDAYEDKIEIMDRHFTGACLFQIENELFLFDLDRREVKEGIINPFLVSLPETSVKTIKDAYESLKPETVKQAEKQKLNVKRQGEWFFIPSDITENFVKSNYKQVKAWRDDKMIYPPLSLRAGRNRPNNATLGFEFNGKVYVKGQISHSGREHKDLKLNGWHEAIPNTATKSWTVTGDVD